MKHRPSELQSAEVSSDRQESLHGPRLDTVGFTFSTAADGLHQLRPVRGTQSRQRAVYDVRHLPAGAGDITIGRSRTDKRLLQAQCSLPKVATGTNVQTSTPEAAVDIIEDLVLPAIYSFVDPTDDLETAHLTRLDSGMDLTTDLVNLGPMLAAYSSAPVGDKRLRKEQFRQEHPSLRIGNPTWGYVTVERFSVDHNVDAPVEETNLDGPVEETNLDGPTEYPPDWTPPVRVEFQAHAHTLESNGLATLGDLMTSPTKAVPMYVSAVERAGLTSEAVAVESWLTTAYETAMAEGWTEDQFDQFAAWMMRPAAMLPPRKLHPATLAKFRRLQKQLGAHPTFFKVSYRFDFENGALLTNRERVLDELVDLAR